MLEKILYLIFLLFGEIKLQTSIELESVYLDVLLSIDYIFINFLEEGRGYLDFVLVLLQLCYLFLEGS